MTKNEVAPIAANLIAERLAGVTLSVASGRYGTGDTVLARMVFLLTGHEEYVLEELPILLAPYSDAERDAAMLRAVADVLDVLESKRLDGEMEGGA
ncbi:MAG: hypothetical protein ABL993_08505 [Vicinamibacterales bacterium]